MEVFDYQGNCCSLDGEGVVDGLRGSKEEI